MFLSLGNPSIYPTKYFHSPITAEHWLRSLMREAMLKDSYAKKAAQTLTPHFDFFLKDSLR
jgi:hypothetical protein